MIWTVAGVGCDEIVRANPRGRLYSRWHGFGATESPAINLSMVFIFPFGFMLQYAGVLYWMGWRVKNKRILTNKHIFDKMFL